MGRQTEKLRGQWNDPPSRPLLRFILLFILCLLILGILYSYMTTRLGSTVNSLLNITAMIAGGLASLLASDVSCVGKEIIYQGFSVEIISECTGLLEMVILSSAIIAYPSSLRAKLVGILGGNITIYVLNVLRIVVLLVVGNHSQKMFKFLHLYFWQATLIIMICAVWVAWLYLVVHREKKTTLAVSG